MTFWLTLFKTNKKNLFYTEFLGNIAFKIAELKKKCIKENNEKLSTINPPILSGYRNTVGED